MTSAKYQHGNWIPYRAWISDSFIFDTLLHELRLKLAATAESADEEGKEASTYKLPTHTHTHKLKSSLKLKL